jgi:hypothetical protein
METDESVADQANTVTVTNSYVNKYLFFTIPAITTYWEAPLQQIRDKPDLTHYC